MCQVSQGSRNVRERSIYLPLYITRKKKGGSWGLLSDIEGKFRED